MAIYRHFPDKANLQAAVLSEAFAVFETYLRKILADVGAIEQLRLLARGFIHFALDKPRNFELFFLSVSNTRLAIDKKQYKSLLNQHLICSRRR